VDAIFRLSQIVVAYINFILLRSDLATVTCYHGPKTMLFRAPCRPLY